MNLATLLQPIVNVLSLFLNPLTSLAHNIGLNLPSVSQVFAQLFGGL